MQIDFYEEFPNNENLEKLKLVKFNTKIFIAAKSLEEFNIIRKKIRKINKKTEVGYWPIIKDSYWISGFSETKDLVELFKELDKYEMPLLIDLEPPLKRSMVLKNFLKVKKNKIIIKRFMENNNERITTAEIPPSILTFFTEVFGLSYEVDCKKSLMFYSSMIPNIARKHIIGHLKKIKNKEDHIIGLGVIAKGILDEPILSPENLENDINLVKKLGFNKIIIYRLGGLNKKYLDVIEKFI